MDESGGVQNQAPNRTSNGIKDSKGKSCKGCLYYSSLQKSKSKTPTCIGLSKTLDQGRFLKFKEPGLLFPHVIDSPVFGVFSMIMVVVHNSIKQGKQFGRS
ncbi:uncharacterized protein E5676_scaffold280G00280 [Cucumis melo var. makuwa]|uniref:DUF8204 domain-containing protein n=1 Tax=Cucumis melo var. makuwa TaxID=1194695 RepID=A0A5A7TW81_CUCMM|nr:uncharacterized protein E6C27_scaffold243G001460 [Cucumis melo var. makuwa]TYK02620.1 uncharacterized protein E5676_scaffold280G00280 [Cucumis melo var. makuwa]